MVHEAWWWVEFGGCIGSWLPSLFIGVSLLSLRFTRCIFFFLLGIFLLLLRHFFLVCELFMMVVVVLFIKRGKNLLQEMVYVISQKQIWSIFISSPAIYESREDHAP
jgi:high-affinity Fe2+/Pb2+ permease